jgi:hypothetical protein
VILDSLRPARIIRAGFPWASESAVSAPMDFTLGPVVRTSHMLERLSHLSKREDGEVTCLARDTFSESFDDFLASGVSTER